MGEAVDVVGAVLGLIDGDRVVGDRVHWVLKAAVHANAWYSKQFRHLVQSVTVLPPFLRVKLMQSYIPFYGSKNA